MILAVLAIFMTAVFAADTNSDTKYATVGRYDYRYWSVISNNQSGSIFAQTTVCLDGMDSAPVGYMGAQARLYSSGGVLKASSEWEYNQESTYPSAMVYIGYDTSSGYYYSKGQARFYTGDGYVTYACAATPNYSPTRSVLESSDVIIQRNENGEIYGSGLFLDEIGVQPDLILAEGTKGEIGYVRAEDINADKIVTPEQAVAKVISGSPSEIPLYDSDGVSVIGTFALDHIAGIVKE